MSKHVRTAVSTPREGPTMHRPAARSRARSCALVLTLLGTTALCAPHDAGAAGNAISPATGNVLTCSSVQFRSTTPVNAQWRSTTEWGTVGALTGLYSAPATAANHPTGGVALLGLPGSSTLVFGSVNLPLATAFPSAVGTVPLNGNLRGINSTVPFEHAFTANGQQVYTVALNGTSEADVYVSNDGGLTFAAAYAHPISVAFAPGSPVTVKNIKCATVAVDAGNSAFTYLATLGYGGSNGAAQVLLAVSSDGGKTYPAATTYVIADASNISYQLADSHLPGRRLAVARPRRRHRGQPCAEQRPEHRHLGGDIWRRERHLDRDGADDRLDPAVLDDPWALRARSANGAGQFTRIPDGQRLRRAASLHERLRDRVRWLRHRAAQQRVGQPVPAVQQ